MYACIRRYELDAPSIEDLAEAGHRFGTALSQAPGFVAAVAVEETGGTLVTVGLFDDLDGLRSADFYAESGQPKTVRGSVWSVSLLQPESWSPSEACEGNEHDRR